MQTDQVLVQTRSYGSPEGEYKGFACGRGVADFKDVLDNPGLLASIAYRAEESGVKRVFVPDCTEFNALVARKKHFLYTIHSVGGSKVSVLHGVRAEGSFLDQSGDACAISTGDCPALVMLFPDGEMFVGHAGLGSVVNLARIKNEKGNNRDHESVIDQVFRVWKGSDRSQIKAFVVCGIQAQSYKHPLKCPIYGERNKKLTQYIIDTYGKECILSHNPGDKELGMINIFKIIRAQLDRYGVLPGNVTHDNVNTADGSDEWWSHRTWYELGQRHPKMRNNPDGRNLVMFWKV